MTDDDSARFRVLRNLRAAEKQSIAIYVEEGHWVAVVRAAVSLVALETEMVTLEDR